MPRRLFPSREERAQVVSLPKHSDQLLSSWHAAGVRYSPASRRVDWLSDPFEMFACAELASLLSQLEEQGLVKAADGDVVVPWERVYEMQSSPEYSSSYPLLLLPPLSPLRPCLASHGSFSDPGFSIFIAGWAGADKVPLAQLATVQGAVITVREEAALLDVEAWKTLQAVATFHQRTPDQRTPESNRACWSVIRQHAKAAGAILSHFLESTVVLTPEMLTIDLRKVAMGGGQVVEVLPNFPGQPPGWLQTFDRFAQVKDHYEVPHGQGLTHVLITAPMQTVLSEIKRMPGRRITGERAEAFLRNPIATLGPDAGSVIDVCQFEQARERAGIAFARFTAQVIHDGPDTELKVNLLIEGISGKGTAHQDFSRVLPLADAGKLEEFIDKVEARIAREAQCCSWHGYELEILGDTPGQLMILREALREWRGQTPYKAASMLDNMLDLSYYSERVEGFGPERSHHLSSHSRPANQQGWLPDHPYSGEADSQQVADEPLRISQDDLEKEVLTPLRNGLIIKPNVERLDYTEPGGDLSIPAAGSLLLPQSLRRDVALFEYQKAGVAWLQHLWSRSPAACRGALLADDMGLGKTIQLLTFLAGCIEKEPNIDPFLIVAPVSLLENWKQEMEKFFLPNTFSLLTLYGPDLRDKRLPRSAIQQELLQAGIVRLLVPGWLGSAKVVLTTYETLRDLEFSLARQKWSVMVCDEAQKIKTPNAMVSRAAKKQNARFKIACTATPIENELADLWCLFDFVQPGLLGSLKDFAQCYRRPVETENNEDNARLDELRKRISPQTLRRTKAEVATNLPRKVEAGECRALLISEKQRAWYLRAVAAFRYQDGNRSPLTMLLHLRTLCSDPRPLGSNATQPQTLAELELHSPKMKWMLTQLSRIKVSQEKAILFCELRDLQRTLQRAIMERFGVLADIINGDTSAAAEKTDSRHKRIALFQQKSGFAVIILSPLAVGIGLNIQAANHVIHFTRTWNPAREDQATDRAYRIGQSKDVFVYYPVVKAHDFVTFDERLDQLLSQKRKLSQDMLNGCGDLNPSDFAMDPLVELRSQNE